MSVHNISYYKRLWEKYEEFNENNQVRRKNASYLNPEYLFIEPLAEFGTRLLMGPLKWGYGAAGNALLKVTKAYDPKLALKVEDALYDPVSTEKLRKNGIWIQEKARVHAIRDPINFPFIQFLDTALISFSRHIYVVSKDLNAIINIPRGLRGYLTAEASKTILTNEEPKSIAGKCWKWIKIGTSKVKDAFLASIQLIVKIAEIPLQYMPIVEVILKKLEKKIEEARDDLHKALLDKAHRVIDESEKTMRRKIVGKVAEVIGRHSVKFFLSSGLKIGFGAGVYFLGKYACSQFLGIEELPPRVMQVSSIGLKALGIYLWVRCMTPTLERLNRDYEENFDPDASTILELSNLFDWSLLHTSCRYAKKILIG